MRQSKINTNITLHMHGIEYICVWHLVDVNHFSHHIVNSFIAYLRLHFFGLAFSIPSAPCFVSLLFFILLTFSLLILAILFVDINNAFKYQLNIARIFIWRCVREMPWYQQEWNCINDGGSWMRGKKGFALEIDAAPLVRVALNIMIVRTVVYN